MMGNQPDDALAVSWRQPLSGILESALEPVDPEPAVWIEHHLDDRSVLQEGCDSRTESRAQHARAARGGLVVALGPNHSRPPRCPARSRRTSETNRKGMITSAATRDLSRAKNRVEKLAIGEVALPRRDQARGCS